MKIGDRIKNERFRKNISQKDLSKLLNIPVSTLANYENNHRIPNIEILSKIATTLDITVDELTEDKPNVIFDIDTIKINSFLDFTRCIGIPEFRDLNRTQLLNIIDNEYLSKLLIKLLELEALTTSIDKIYEEKSDDNI